MRVANLEGRLSLVSGARVIDVHGASGGQFGPDTQAVYERWDEFVEWAGALDAGPQHTETLVESALENPVPAPRQVFAIGLNYADHASESKLAVPQNPPVFTKYRTSLTGPYGDIELPTGDVDWEVELVVVIGRAAHKVPEERGWDYVAGLSVGQDISERQIQLEGPAPQFSLGKSYPGFGPIGPLLVTPGELTAPDDLELGCFINGEQVQKGSTADMVFTVPQLVSRLSAVAPLLPGDVIFTGTPAGVGLGRTPARYLSDGDELVSYIDGIGQMRHRFISPDKPE
jgi:2-keto-4-pentenoate hydratase/2-oxohepta-3-ene-1,7-dioic acid hydratase in catechol pathway